MASGRGLPPGITNSGPVQVGGQVQLFGDTGAPDAAVADDGSFYFRADPADAGGSFFVKVAGAWVQASIGGACTGLAGFPAEWLNATTLQPAGAAIARIKLGPGAAASADGAIAIGGFVLGPGAGPLAVAANSIAIGAGGNSPDVAPEARGGDGIAIGRGSTAGLVAGQVGCIGIGRQALAHGAGQHIAIGESASSQGVTPGGIAIGFQSESGGNGRNIAIGHTALAGFTTDNIAIGRSASAQGTRCIALGDGAAVTVGLTGAAAIGDSAQSDLAGRVHLAYNEFFFGRFALRNRILRPRITGWTVPTGTSTRTGFATSTVTLAVLAEHVKALLEDLGLADGTGHGLIGA